jgi:hypothetical protein
METCRRDRSVSIFVRDHDVKIDPPRNGTALALVALERLELLALRGSGDDDQMRSYARANADDIRRALQNGHAGIAAEFAAARDAMSRDIVTAAQEQHVLSPGFIYNSRISISNADPMAPIAFHASTTFTAPPTAQELERCECGHYANVHDVDTGCWKNTTATGGGFCECTRYRRKPSTAGTRSPSNGSSSLNAPEPPSTDQPGSNADHTSTRGNNRAVAAGPEGRLGLYAHCAVCGDLYYRASYCFNPRCRVGSEQHHDGYSLHPDAWLPLVIDADLRECERIAIAPVKRGEAKSLLREAIRAIRNETTTAHARRLIARARELMDEER